MRSGISCVLVVMMVSLGGVAQAEWAGKEVKKDGELYVQNPEQAVEVVRVELEELWERGAEDDDEVMFGRLAQLVHDADGNLYVLDSQLSEIHVFSPSGEFLRTVGREGEGPGEFSNVFDMYLGPHGLLGLIRIFPGRVYQIGTDGSPADDFPLPAVDGFQLAYIGQANSDRIVIAGARQYREEGRTQQVSYLKAFDTTGKELVYFCDRTQETQYGGMQFDEKTFSDFTRRWALASDGRVAVAMEFDDYRIHVWNADGTLNRIIDRPNYVSLERTGAQKKRFQTMYDAITSWNPNSTFKISDTHVDVSRIWFRDNGNLWVLASSGIWQRDDGIFASIDEYDRDGHYVRRLDFAVEGDPVEDGIFILGDRMYRVTDLFSAMMAALGGSDETDDILDADPLRLIAYRLAE